MSRINTLTSLSDSASSSSTMQSTSLPSSTKLLKLKDPRLFNLHAEYRQILSQSLFYELKYLVDVVQGRAKNRQTTLEQLKNGFLTLLKIVVPVLPISELTKALFDIGQTIGEHLEADEKSPDSLIHSLLVADDKRLRILTDRVAAEASCYWDLSLTHWLVDSQSVQAFAVAGSFRIIDWLSRQRNALSVEGLVRGLIEGRSGKEGPYVSSNTTLNFDTCFPFAELGRNFTAEGLYGRSGYVTLEGDFYIHSTHTKYERELKTDRRQLTDDPHKINFGYVKLLKDDIKAKDPNAKRPKYGYVRLPNQDLVGKYEYIKHKPHLAFKRLIAESKTSPEIKGCRWVSVAKIEKYLVYCQTESQIKNQPLSFNSWLGYQAFFRGKLDGKSLGKDLGKKLNMEIGDFSGVDFSGANLQNCTLRNFQKANLVGAKLENVTACGPVFDGACLDLVAIRNSHMNGLKSVQLVMRFARITNTTFADFECVDADLTGLDDWDEKSRESLLPGKIELELKTLSPEAQHPLIQLEHKDNKSVELEIPHGFSVTKSGMDMHNMYADQIDLFTAAGPKNAPNIYANQLEAKIIRGASMSTDAPKSAQMAFVGGFFSQPSATPATKSDISSEDESLPLVSSPSSSSIEKKEEGKPVEGMDLQRIKAPRGSLLFKQLGQTGQMRLHDATGRDGVRLLSIDPKNTAEELLLIAVQEFNALNSEHKSGDMKLSQNSQGLISSSRRNKQNVCEQLRSRCIIL